MSRLTSALIGMSIIGLGLFPTKWLIEGLSAPTGVTQGVPPLIHLLLIQLLCVSFGILLVRPSRVVKRAMTGALIALAVFLVANGWYVARAGQADRQPDPRRAATLLDRVIFLDGTKLADLSLESAEIMYRPQTAESSRSFRIPPTGILDTAIGVDPLITDLFTGRVYFEVSQITSEGEPRILFRKDLDISSWGQADFTWRKVAIDLSEYAGTDLRLLFRKGYVLDQPHEPDRGVYDLLPIDFMYWRAPTVRPRRLAEHRNVILISLDTLRADHLHYQGYRRQTSPNLDRFARHGTFFSTVVTQAPWTTPAHFSILTSRYPHVHQGVQPLTVTNRRWNKTLPTLASILREQGYLTAAFTGSGAISAKFGLYTGFDFYNETTSLEPDEAVCGAGDAEGVFGKASEWVGDNRDRTFFLFLHTYEPHYPYCDEFFLRQEGISAADPIAHRTARYDGDIRRADAFVGRFIERLNSLDLLDRTLVVITSDHGEDLDPPKRGLRHGHNLSDELLLVPLIFYGPGIIPSGRAIAEQVRSIDILPTVLDYVGVAVDDQFDGSSLRGMIDGRDTRPRPAYSEATLYGADRESVRANGYKYVGLSGFPNAILGPFGVLRG